MYWYFLPRSKYYSRGEFTLSAIKYDFRTFSEYAELTYSIGSRRVTLHEGTITGLVSVKIGDHKCSWKQKREIVKSLQPVREYILEQIKKAKAEAQKDLEKAVKQVCLTEVREANTKEQLVPHLLSDVEAERVLAQERCKQLDNLEKNN